MTELRVSTKYGTGVIAFRRDGAGDLSIRPKQQDWPADAPMLDLAPEEARVLGAWLLAAFDLPEGS